jgi:hypothetical protein
MSDDVIIKEYSGSDGWYKIYQSGIIEQGTKIYSAASIKDIQLPVNHANTDYSVMISHIPQYIPKKHYTRHMVSMTKTNITTTMKENVEPMFFQSIDSENQFEVTSDVSRAKYQWFTKGYCKELEYKTFAINPTPSDAMIIINGIEQNNIQYPCGKYLTYTVKKDGYQTITNTVTITDDLTIDVNLELQYYNYIIRTTPFDATVIINGIEQNTLYTLMNTEINWEINRYGYISQSGTDILTNDIIKKVKLEKMQFTYTINPTPSDAVVIINGIEQNTITADYGSLIDWEVSMEGYTLQNGQIELIEDVVNDVILEEIPTEIPTE